MAGCLRSTWEPEIRDFPKGLDNGRLEALFDSCLRGIANIVNLRSCTWTRDGSLGSDILLALLRHRSLRELEINGRHNGNYDHMILPQFTSVRRIKLIMPAPHVVEILPVWLTSLAHPLQSLSIICKVRHALSPIWTRLPRKIKLELFRRYGCVSGTNFRGFARARRTPPDRLPESHARGTREGITS
jgi:hypothetical protein